MPAPHRFTIVPLLTLISVPAAGLAGTPSLATTTVQSAPAPVAPPAPESSYDIGLVLGSQLAHSGAGSSVVFDEIVRGLKDSLAGREASPSERQAATDFLRSTREALAARNRAAAEAFLAQNAKQPGVTTLPSGLQYRVINAGQADAASLQANDQVTVRYRASLIDGTVFDRSEAHGGAATFRMGSVFRSWQEALRQMKIGATWQLFAPPDLAYGNNTPPGVPPGSAVIYELELLSVQPPPLMKSDDSTRPVAKPAPAH